MKGHAGSGCWPRPLAVFLVLISLVTSASADETDNFYLPLDPEFADLGDFLEAVHTRAIEQGVQEVNGRIERALDINNRTLQTRRLETLHAPEAVTQSVARQFGNPLTETRRIEAALDDPWAQRRYPDQAVVHFDISLHLRGHAALDPRALLMLFQAGTIKAYGVYFGTDKLLHFHQVGHRYCERYRTLLEKGLPPEPARERVISHFAEEGFLAESRGFGSVSTGIYSNGDMAANFAGFKFFLNLTERVVLLGEERPPLVVRCGVFWRLNNRVRTGSGWFRGYISDHWNEALNPSLYNASMRPHIRRILQDRARHIVEFYTQKDDRPADAAYFEELAHTLATHAGEAYGHSGRFPDLMHIGNTCLPEWSP